MSRKDRFKKSFPPNSTAVIPARSISPFDNIRSEIRYADLASLIPRADNPRTHSPKQIKKIGASIHAFGFITPILVDGQNHIIAGNARAEAARQICWTRVPVVCVEHLSPKALKAFALAENRLAELAGWDNKLLSLDLKEIALETSFDVSVLGWETPELDLIIGGAAGPNPQDEIPLIVRSAPAISRPGDLFLIGRHRVLCGDASSAASYQLLLADRRAQLCFTDPPYNVKIAGHVSRRGKIQHPEFAQASGEMSPEQFKAFLASTAANIEAFSQDGAIIFMCIDWRHAYDLQTACIPILGQPLNQIVWVKANAGMGSLYRSQHEFVFVFKKGAGRHINNVQLGKFGRSRSNVWNYPGLNSFGNSRDENLAMHPTVKPVAMVADAIMDCSNRGAIILDPFLGSGTTLIAAENTGRIGYGMEIDPYYVDTILRRLEKTHGLKAIHAETGLGLEELSLHRRNDSSPIDGPPLKARKNQLRTRGKK